MTVTEAIDALEIEIKTLRQERDNALVLASHAMRCNGELLELLYKEKSGGFNRIQYQETRILH